MHFNAKTTLQISWQEQSAGKSEYHINTKLNFYHKVRFRSECDLAASYGAGICAGVAAFGAPIVCAVSGLRGLPCALAEGVLWGFGGYCTSGAPHR